MPNGNGKKIKVAVLCEDSKNQEAKDSGADLVNSDTLIKDIGEGKINFDKLVSTPAMMPKLGKLGKILGPKGLMPNPKLGTVTNNIKSIVSALKSGQIEIKNDPDHEQSTMRRIIVRNFGRIYVFTGKGKTFDEVVSSFDFIDPALKDAELDESS